MEQAERVSLLLEQAVRVSLLERAEVVDRQLKQVERDRWDRLSETDRTDEGGQMRQTKRGR